MCRKRTNPEHIPQEPSKKKTLSTESGSHEKVDVARADCLEVVTLAAFQFVSFVLVAGIERSIEDDVALQDGRAGCSRADGIVDVPSGCLIRGSGKLLTAEYVVNRSVRLVDDDDRSHAFASRSLRKLGRPTEALEHYKNASGNEGANQWLVRRELADAYIDAGSEQDAISMLEGVDRRGMTYEETRDIELKIAKAYYSQGDEQKSRVVLENWAQQNPDDPAIVKVLADMDRAVSQ